MNTSISFQESNIDWIGNIPYSWKLKKGKYLFSNKKEINSDFQCDNLLSLTLFGVLNKDMESSEGLRPLDYTTYQIFEKDDLVFKLIDLENKKTSRVGLVHEKGIMSPVYIRLIPKVNSLPRYFYYQYYDLYKKYIFNYLGSGVRSSLNPTDLMEMPLVYPPLPEQKQIVSFLDTKTQKIDELIEKTEKKIELLKEKRTTLINHCVTKGLNPNAEMKDSGVEWIGEIPSGWGLIQLKYLTSKVGSGVTPRGGSDVYIDEGIPFLRSQNIHFRRLVLDDVVYISQEIHEQMSSSKVVPNDVLFNITGGSIGRCFYTEPNSIEYNVNQHVCIIRPNEKILTKFLYYCLYSNLGQIQVSLNNTGSGKEGLNFQNIKGFILTNVNKNEQQEIVDYLDKQTQKIDTTIEKETQRIELLKEYRQSLISEVVTGKIDVRDWKE